MKIGIILDIHGNIDALEAVLKAFENSEVESHLSEASKQYIHKLPKELFYKVEGKSIYIVHYPMDTNEKFRKHIKLANIKENEEMFSEINADIYLYGHTHASVYNKNYNKIYINPGALGCPGKTNKAPYGILNICNNKIL